MERVAWVVAICSLGFLILPFLEVHMSDAPKSSNIHWHEGNVTREERWTSLGVKGVTLWFTGMFFYFSIFSGAFLDAENIL